MIQVYQTVIDKGYGNCKQAAVASLFDLDLSQVPNFILYPDKIWPQIYFSFINSLGWEVKGSGYPVKLEDRVDGFSYDLTDGYDVNGYIEASVKSKTFKGVSHSVIINTKGMVVHDPNPNKLWRGLNVKVTGELISWTLYKQLKDLGKLSRVCLRPKCDELVNTRENKYCCIECECEHRGITEYQHYEEIKQEAAQDE